MGSCSLRLRAPQQVSSSVHLSGSVWDAHRYIGKEKITSENKAKTPLRSATAGLAAKIQCVGVFPAISAEKKMIFISPIFSTALKSMEAGHFRNVKQQFSTNFHAVTIRYFSSCFYPVRILFLSLSRATFLFVCLQWFPVQKPQWTLEGFTRDLETIPLDATPLVLQKKMENGEREARHEKPVQLDADMTQARLLDSVASGGRIPKAEHSLSVCVLCFKNKSGFSLKLTHLF